MLQDQLLDGRVGLCNSVTYCTWCWFVLHGHLLYRMLVCVAWFMTEQGYCVTGLAVGWGCWFV